MSTWINYAEQRPEAAGAYRWRLPSLAMPGIFVIFTAHMRERGAGFENVLSPMFDYWDGYCVHVPDGLRWQELDAPTNCARHEVKDVAIEGLEIRECPYCLKVPKLDGVLRYIGGGVGISEPNKFNSWQLKCCTWGQTPTYADPRELVARRDAVLASLAKPVEQHQGEPVAPAFVMPSCESSYGFGYVDGTCIQSLRGYRDHLEEIVDSIPEGPLYTHADPGEVERLQGLLKAYMNAEAEKGIELVKLRTERKRMDEALVACANERDELRKANTEFEAQVGSDFKAIDDLRAQLASAVADKEAYAQNAIDLRRRVENADLALRAQLAEVRGVAEQIYNGFAEYNAMRFDPLSETYIHPSTGREVENGVTVRVRLLKALGTALSATSDQKVKP